MKQSREHHVSGIFKKKKFPNPKLPSRFHQVLIIVYLWYGCILKEGSRIEKEIHDSKKQDLFFVSQIIVKK